MHLDSPSYLILLLIIPLLIWNYFYRKNPCASIPFPFTSRLRSLSSKYPVYLGRILFIMRILAIVLLVIAVTRPKSTHLLETEETEGIDIMLSLDISSSMLAEDFEPNRITAAKEVIKDFIKRRKNDRIGLVVFSGESYTQCPLTTDYGIIAQFLNDIDVGMIQDGTAIGMAIATALSRLKDSEAKSRIIILLTDGENNSGRIDPLTASKMAESLGIKIYAIGVGKKGGAPIPVKLPDGRKVYARNRDGSLQLTRMNEESLKEIARISGGAFFRATKKRELKKIYNDIDRLEKNRVIRHSFRRYREYFPYWILAAIIILSIEIGVRNTIARTFP